MSRITPHYETGEKCIKGENTQRFRRKQHRRFEIPKPAQPKDRSKGSVGHLLVHKSVGARTSTERPDDRATALRVSMDDMALHVALLASFGFAASLHAQAANLEKVYRDETHCLVEVEIRSAADKAISCYCRDALTEARYVWQTYLTTGKDRNLNGVYISLLLLAGRSCGDNIDVTAAAESEWNGPEVTRTYPPDKTIEQLAPDKKGNRSVEYAVLLTFHDRQGHVTKVVNFIARDVLPPDFKKNGCPPSAVCPK